MDRLFVLLSFVALLEVAVSQSCSFDTDCFAVSTCRTSRSCNLGTSTCQYSFAGTSTMCSTNFDNVLDGNCDGSGNCVAQSCTVPSDCRTLGACFDPSSCSGTCQRNPQSYGTLCGAGNTGLCDGSTGCIGAASAVGFVAYSSSYTVHCPSWNGNTLSFTGAFYTNSMNCNYSIPAGYSLTVTQLDLEGCCDYIAFNYESNTYAALASLPAMPIAGPLWIRFHSDGSVIYTGAVMTISRTVPCTGTADCTNPADSCFLTQEACSGGNCATAYKTAGTGCGSGYGVCNQGVCEPDICTSVFCGSNSTCTYNYCSLGNCFVGYSDDVPCGGGALCYQGVCACGSACASGVCNSGVCSGAAPNAFTMNGPANCPVWQNGFLDLRNPPTSLNCNYSFPVNRSLVGIAMNFLSGAYVYPNYDTFNTYYTGYPTQAGPGWVSFHSDSSYSGGSIMAALETCASNPSCTFPTSGTCFMATGTCTGGLCYPSYRADGTACGRGGTGMCSQGICVGEDPCYGISCGISANPCYVNYCDLGVCLNATVPNPCPGGQCVSGICTAQGCGTCSGGYCNGATCVDPAPNSFTTVGGVNCPTFQTISGYTVVILRTDIATNCSWSYSASYAPFVNLALSGSDFLSFNYELTQYQDSNVATILPRTGPGWVRVFTTGFNPGGDGSIIFAATCSTNATCTFTPNGSCIAVQGYCNNGICVTNNAVDNTPCGLGATGRCTSGQCLGEDLCYGVNCTDPNPCLVGTCSNGFCSTTQAGYGTTCPGGLCQSGSCVTRACGSCPGGQCSGSICVGQPPATGFVAYGNSATVNCPGWSGNVLSISGATYLNSMSCNYSIPSGYTLNFTTLSTEGCCDYVTLDYSGTYTDISQLPTGPFRGPMWISFHSDSSVTSYPGVVVTLTRDTPCTVACTNPADSCFLSSETCTAGNCATAYKTTGTACGSGFGSCLNGVCKIDNCASLNCGASNTTCRGYYCTGGACSFINTPFGSPCTANTTCRSYYCSSGSCVSANAADGTPCAGGSCSSGTCVSSPCGTCTSGFCSGSICAGQAPSTGFVAFKTGTYATTCPSWNGNTLSFTGSFYTNSMSCNYSIPAGYSLTVTQLDLETCCDYISFNYGGNTYATLASLPTMPIPGPLWVKFYTDSSVVRTGAVLTISRTIPCTGTADCTNPADSCFLQSEQCSAGSCATQYKASGSSCGSGFGICNSGVCEPDLCTGVFCGTNSSCVGYYCRQGGCYTQYAGLGTPCTGGGCDGFGGCVTTGCGSCPGGYCVGTVCTGQPTNAFTVSGTGGCPDWNATRVVSWNYQNNANCTWTLPAGYTAQIVFGSSCCDYFTINWDNSQYYYYSTIPPVSGPAALHFISDASTTGSFYIVATGSCFSNSDCTYSANSCYQPQGVCNAGVCIPSNKQNGVACGVGNTGTCSNGICTGEDPCYNVNCGSSTNECILNYCSGGTCFQNSLPNGSPCTGGTCSGGSCAFSGCGSCPSGYCQGTVCTGQAPNSFTSAGSPGCPVWNNNVLVLPAGYDNNMDCYWSFPDGYLVTVTALDLERCCDYIYFNYDSSSRYATTPVPNVIGRGWIRFHSDVSIALSGFTITANPVCTSNLQCTSPADSCQVSPGTCSGGTCITVDKPNGVTCGRGLTGTCFAGICTNEDPCFGVVCGSSSDGPCSVPGSAVCIRGIGCVPQPRPDGDPCGSGNVCQSGNCVAPPCTTCTPCNPPPNTITNSNARISSVSIQYTECQTINTQYLNGTTNNGNPTCDIQRSVFVRDNNVTGFITSQGTVVNRLRSNSGSGEVCYSAVSTQGCLYGCIQASAGTSVVLTIENTQTCNGVVCTTHVTQVNAQVATVNVNDPCAGVTCNTPPNADCYSRTGTCANGVCNYQMSTNGASCGASGSLYTCFAGKCYSPTDPCKDKTCATPPNSLCYQATGVCSTPEGTTTALCTYTVFADNTPCGGTKQCQAGSCVSVAKPVDPNSASMSTVSLLTLFALLGALFFERLL